MIKESNVAARGQVFYYNPIWGIYGKNREPKTTYQNNGSLEFKTRPYLVISTDKGNFSSTTCNVIPITTRDDISIPSQVKFVFNGRSQVILTEQITTCNFRDLGEYCYTVSEEILAKVQKGMYIQFGLNLRTPEVTMEELANKLEAVVDKVIENAKRKAQSVTIPQDTIDNLAIKLGSAVEDLVNVPESVAVVTESTSKFAERENPVCTNVSHTAVNVDETKVEKVVKEEPKKEEPKKVVQDVPKVNRTPNYSGMSAIEKFNARYSRSQGIQAGKTTTIKDTKPQASKTPTSSVTDTDKKPRKQPWDIEKQRQFLADCDKLTPDELMEKYEFQTKKDVYNHKYLIKNRLGNSDK